MGSIKTESVCQNLIYQKTYVLLIDNQETKATANLSNAINNNSSLNVQLDITDNESKIPNHDLYVVNLHNINIDNQNKIIRSVFAANPKAILFIISKESSEVTDKIKNMVYDLTDLSRFGKIVQGFIDPDKLDFSCVIKYLDETEKIKQRLTHLWCKLESANQKLFDIE